MAILPQVFTVPSMVTGASVTSSIELAGDFVFAYLEIPTMSAYNAATVVYVQASSDNVTFRRFANPDLSTGVAGVGDFSIASGISNRFVYLPNFSFRYIKVEVSAIVSSVAGVVPAPFKVVCVSNQ